MMPEKDFWGFWRDVNDFCYLYQKRKSLYFMKKYISFILLFLSFQDFAQTVKIGDSVPDFTFEKVVNHSKSTLNLREAKGKILITEFWGTWCGPCIPYLEHLSELQKKFKDDIVVVGISDDTEARLNNFLLKRPVSLPLVSDPMNKSYQFFKVPAVPRTFVANREGKIIAITHPSEITEEKLTSLIRGKNVELKASENEKQGKGKQDYFGTDLKTTFAFTMKPMIDTMPIMILQTWRNHLFEGRRLSFINVTTDFFIQKIFQKSNPETLILVDKKQFEFKPENRFCFDIIVPEEDKTNFYQIAQEEIQRRLKYKIYTEKRETEVYILKRISDSSNLKTSILPPRRSSSIEI
jgi:peroxiredoxin